MPAMPYTVVELSLKCGNINRLPTAGSAKVTLYQQPVFEAHVHDDAWQTKHATREIAWLHRSLLASKGVVAPRVIDRKKLAVAGMVPCRPL